MLTRQQLQRIAQRQRIGLHAQERDYLQHLLTALLYFRSQDLIFKLEFTPQALREAITRVAPAWERDLRPLLPQFVAFDEARRVVETLP